MCAEGEAALSWPGSGTRFVSVCAFSTWLEEKKAFAATKRESRKRKATGEAVSEEAAEAAGEKEEEEEEEEDNGLEGKEAPSGVKGAATARAAAFPPACIVKLSALPAHLSGLELKDFFRTLADVRFVDHESGASEAVARLGSAEEASKLLAALASEVTFPGAQAGVKVETLLLAGEEEVAYWAKNAADFAARKDARGGGEGRGRGRGRGRGGGRGGRGRGGGSFKKQRV